MSADDLWLNLGAMIAGVLLMFGWHLATHGSTPSRRRNWNIVRFAALGYLVFWLIVVGPTLIGVLFDGL